MFQKMKQIPMPDFLKSHIVDFRKHNAVKLVEIQQLGHIDMVKNIAQSAAYRIGMYLKNNSALFIEMYEVDNIHTGYTIYLRRDETFYGLDVNYYNHHEYEITLEKLLDNTQLSSFLKELKRETNAANLVSKFLSLTSSADAPLSLNDHEVLLLKHIDQFSNLRNNNSQVLHAKFNEEQEKFSLNEEAKTIRAEINLLDLEIIKLQQLRSEKRAKLAELSKDLTNAKQQANEAALLAMEPLFIPQFKYLKTPLTKKA